MGATDQDGARPPRPPRRLVLNIRMRDLSPEARRRRVGRLHGHLADRLRLHLGHRGFAITQRVITGVWRDGFIHAGNLAYMALLSLFPFFIVVGALFSLAGQEAERAASVRAFLSALPAVVSSVLEPVAMSVIEARHGWLMWAGLAVGLWTVSSLIETIRDILRRAYGTPPPPRGLLQHRLGSTGLVVLAAMLLLGGLFMQIALAAALEVIPLAHREWHSWAATVRITQLLPMVVLFGALYLLFFTLAPRHYRLGDYPKWPGALLVAAWWMVVSKALPLGLKVLFKYDLTYGSMAGVMIALFFFWLVGLGMVTGAELNAALAITPEERDWLDQAADRQPAG